ncbi:MAG: GNAT family N-acetyltransferase [Halobacteriovorax sp.]|nr:GNAT family N-acetyltransferase [Halobacteriovorax sp.]
MIEVKESIFDFDKKVWNDLVPDNHPFLKYEFFQALEESKCIGAESGWLPFYLTSPSGVLPIFLKSHSYGEFIFDWSWAQAYEKYRLPYYPKLTCAIPHSPVSAPKLITTKSDQTISDFLPTIEELSKKYNCSSYHFLFTTQKESQALRGAGIQERHSIQFHWQNRQYSNFNDFLNSLKKDKRKNIKKEREKLHASDIRIIQKTGNEISKTDADFLAKVYLKTIEKKWSQAYLNQDFFTRWLDYQKEQIILFIAYDNDSPIACAIHLKSDTTLYGRYWGCLKDIPFLHFELCYYLAIEFAIKHKLEFVEAGAQGEQKLLRGFEPVTILSHHKIMHTGFARAIHTFIENEKEQLAQLKIEYEKALPFKKTSAQ